MSEILYEEFRNDGRKAFHIRSIISEIGGHVSNGSDGYIRLKQGNTEVIASISGPHDCRVRSDAKHDTAILSCRYAKCPTANVNGRRRHGKRDTRSELNASYIKDIMKYVVQLNCYGGSQIDISVQVIKSDGSELAVAINAVSLALMDAGIRMKDFVVAASIGLYDQTILADLNRFEEKQSSLPQLTMVLLPNSQVDENGARLYRIYPQKIHISQMKMMCAAAEDVCEAVHKELNKQIKLYVAAKLYKQRAIEGRSTN